MRNEKNATRNIMLTGMFAAVLAILSQIQIPMPSGVPVTLQTFTVALIGFILGVRYGTMSVFIYVLVGAVGLPVFTGLKGGAASLTGPTGGFIWGFFILTAICGYAYQKKCVCRWLLILTGVALCHVTGIIQFMIVMQVEFWQAVLWVSVPYLPKDLLSIVLAYTTARGVKRRLAGSGIYF